MTDYQNPYPECESCYDLWCKLREEKEQTETLKTALRNTLLLLRNKGHQPGCQAITTGFPCNCGWKEKVLINGIHVLEENE